MMHNRRVRRNTLALHLNIVEQLGLLMTPELIKRCEWARKPLDIPYHDCEWGVPVHDERLLFEFLILEGAQAGLSWSTILAKRDGYRKAFANFEAGKVARFD